MHNMLNYIYQTRASITDFCDIIVGGGGFLGFFLQVHTQTVTKRKQIAGDIGSLVEDNENTAPRVRNV